MRVGCQATCPIFIKSVRRHGKDWTLLQAFDPTNRLSGFQVAFISNPDEELRLADESYQEKLADAMLRGIRQYFTRHPPGPTQVMRMEHEQMRALINEAVDALKQGNTEDFLGKIASIAFWFCA